MEQTPDDLFCLLSAMEERVSSLKKIANTEGVHREFTLDGRFVGDIGELIAHRCFKIELHHNQKSDHDAVYVENNARFNVQIKVRRACDAIDLKASATDRLLVLNFSKDWKSWEVVYNGVWPHISGEKQRFNVANLRKLYSKSEQSFEIPRRST
jgi:hypothetical protein